MARKPGVAPGASREEACGYFRRNTQCGSAFPLSGSRKFCSDYTRLVEA